MQSNVKYVKNAQVAVSSSSRQQVVRSSASRRSTRKSPSFVERLESHRQVVGNSSTSRQVVDNSPCHRLVIGKSSVYTKISVVRRHKSTTLGEPTTHEPTSTVSGVYDLHVGGWVVRLDVRVDGLLDHVLPQLRLGQERPDGRLVAAFRKLVRAVQVADVF